MSQKNAGQIQDIPIRLSPSMGCENILDNIRRQRPGDLGIFEMMPAKP